MKIMVINAGIPRPQSCQSICTAWRTIKNPTTTRAGATASKGTIVTSGEAIIATRNNTPVTIFARPVRAPSPIPVADSTKIWFAEPDAPPPTTEPTASTSSTSLMFSTLPSLSMVPASVAKPTETPMASKKTESRIANTNRDAPSTPIAPNAPNRADPISEKSGAEKEKLLSAGTLSDQPVGFPLPLPIWKTASRMIDSAVDATTPMRIAPRTLRINKAMVRKRPKINTRVGQPSR